MCVLLVCIYVLLYLHVMSVCVLVCLLVSLFVCLCVYLFFTGVDPQIRHSRLENKFWSLLCVFQTTFNTFCMSKEREAKQNTLFIH